MRFTTSTEMIPAATLQRRITPWIVIVAALVVGITLCLIYGPRIVPFFGTTV
jgi:hypothetical protein